MCRWINRLMLPLVALASATVLADPCDFGALNPDAPSETSQFAFMIGDHEVTLHAWTGQDWTPPRPVNARWHGWYGLEGMAIYDEWIDPEPSGGGRGVNVRLYDPDEAIWKMMWISTNGKRVQDLRAQMVDGRLTMWQVYPERRGWKAVFEQIDENRWARVSYLQDESGEWRPQYRLEATRRACAP
jgi:hypothetical protein